MTDISIKPETAEYLKLKAPFWHGQLTKPGGMDEALHGREKGRCKFFNHNDTIYDLSNPCTCIMGELHNLNQDYDCATCEHLSYKVLQLYRMPKVLDEIVEHMKAEHQEIKNPIEGTA